MEEKKEEVFERIWKELPLEIKQKLIEKINERSDYQWEASYWPKVSFTLLPLVLKKLLEKELRRKKFSAF